MSDIECPDCEHPATSHDDFGCAKWLQAKHGAKMCECGKTKRELEPSEGTTR